MPKVIKITTVPLSLKLLLSEQMKYLKSNGWDVLMVSADGREVNEVVKREGCRHEVIPFTRKVTPFQDLYCLWLLIRLFRRENPDIVHTHTPKAGLLGMLAARFAGVPVRIHTLAGLPYLAAEKSRRKMLVAMEKLTYKHATEVWPNAHHLKDFIVSENLVDPSKVKVIGMGSSNGVDLTKFERNELKENHLVAAMMRIVPGENDFIILSVGRLVKDKGIEHLVEAFLKSKVINHSKLVFLGAFEQELNPLRGDIVRKINDHPRIVHVEWTDHVAHYMAISDVLVHASFREGLPNVLLEAGAIECPVICSDIPGNAEVITHLKTGLVYPGDDVGALQEAIEYAYVKRDVMQGFAGKLSAEVQEKYDRASIHPLILENYKRLLNS